MADYFKILTGAIAQQGLKDSAARQALYDRVRKVLDSQLAGMDSDNSVSIGDQHRKTLDDAIAKIEAASVDIVSTDAPKIEPAIQVQKPADRPIPPSTTGPASDNDADGEQPTTTTTGTKPETNSQPPKAGAYVAPPQTSSSVEPVTPRVNSGRATPAGGYLKPPSTSERMAAESKGRRSGARNFFIALVLFLVVAAGLGYWQRDNLDAYAGPVIRAVGEFTTRASDTLGEMTGLWSSSTPPMAENDNQVTGDAGTSDTNGSSPNATASQTPDDSAASAESAPVQVSAAPPDAPQVTIVEPSQPVPPTAEPTEDTPTAVVENQATPVAVGPAPSEAYLLIEGNADEGQPDDRIRGRANWSLVEGGNLLRIEAQMSSPDSRLVIEIAKNEDTGLPASHTVTYNYAPALVAPDGPIVNFPSFMTRADDTAESVPLRGVGALILPNQYLMGLSDKPEDREYNQQLLENAKWIVVPVVFENNRRGLFLIEFGETGREVYAAAQAEWGEAVVQEN